MSPSAAGTVREGNGRDRGGRHLRGGPGDLPHGPGGTGSGSHRVPRLARETTGTRPPTVAPRGTGSPRPKGARAPLAPQPDPTGPRPPDPLGTGVPASHDHPRWGQTPRLRPRARKDGTPGGGGGTQPARPMSERNVKGGWDKISTDTNGLSERVWPMHDVSGCGGPRPKDAGGAPATPSPVCPSTAQYGPADGNGWGRRCGGGVINGDHRSLSGGDRGAPPARR